MRVKPRKIGKAESGVSLMELLVVVFVTLIMAALASPSIMQTVYNIRLRTAAGDLAGLIQQARIMSAKNNTSYDIVYTTYNGVQIAFVDVNLNGTYNPGGEPEVEFSGSVVPAAGAPSGSGGQPPAYVLTGDTSTGAVFTNTSTLAFSSRGLPCNWDTSTSPPTCSTPATNYFTYYLTDARTSGAGWACVVVTKAGRSKVVMWDGTSWH